MSEHLDAALRSIDDYLDNPTQRAGDYAYPSEWGDGSDGRCWRCRRNPTDDPAALCEGCRAFMLEDTDIDPAADPPRRRIGLEFGPPPTWLDVDPRPRERRPVDLYTITPANRRLGGISGMAAEIPLEPQSMSPNELRRLMGITEYDGVRDYDVVPPMLAPFRPPTFADWEAMRREMPEVWDRLVEALTPCIDAIADALQVLADTPDPLERAQARRAQARAARDRGLPSSRRPPRSMRP